MKETFKRLVFYWNRRNFLPAVLLLWMVLFISLPELCHATLRDSSMVKPATKKPDYYIDDDQDRIDMLDGVSDHNIHLADSASTVYANHIFFGLVDSIQQLIDNSGFDDAKKKACRDNLYLQMRRAGAYTINNVKRFDISLHFLYGELNAMLQKKLCAYLLRSINQSFGTFSVFKNESCADSFLLYAAHIRPDLVFMNYELYSNKDYAQHVIEETAKIAPVTVKRYFNPNDPIFLALKKSDDTIVKIIIEIKEKFTRKSNAFTLLDGIVNGDYSIEAADAIGNNPRKFLNAMLGLRAKKHPLAEHSLEEDLAVYSLKFVRVLNDLHNEKDAVRFASIENFTPEELYTLMVYSEEEIFTSTFNGLFNRLIIKLGPVSGYEFLGHLGDNRFRTFIKMCAGFGKLSPFLQSMTALHQQMLMIKFASGLEEYNDLSQAVEVADAFGSITDSLVLKILRSTIKVQYIQLKAKHNTRGATIYGLLSNLFVERNISNSNWFTSVSAQYAVPNFDHISNKKLFNNDSVSRWLIYFYDDEDGESSFATFIKTFTNPGWAIIDSGNYVILKSKKGMKVHIYANKPKNEYDGQAKLEKIFNDKDYEPNVMVHRGHSYYAFKTIEKVKDNTQIFVLGSCGGYHSISSIIDRSADISIISSKQIGTKFVNNPMLKLMADCISEGKDVEWQNLWTDLEVAVKNNPKAYERFLDYIPPHKNLGAIFIKTYNKLTEQD